MKYTARLLAAIGVAAMFLGPGAERLLAEESATVTVPGSVSFTVRNVSLSTTGSPEPTRVAFSDATLLPDRVVRISVRAESDTFVNGTDTFAASLVSWSIAGTTNGTGLSGVLSATSWTPVFEGYVNHTEGAADLTWTLSAPGRTRAGTHTLGLQWKIESIVP